MVTLTVAVDSPPLPSQASINEWGADYTGGDTSKVIKYELWIDASTLAEHNANANGILGYQFKMGIDPASVQDLNWSVTSGDTFGTTNTSITFNPDSGAVAVASSSAIVDTNPANDGPPDFISSDKLIATFYLNPTDQSVTEILIAFNETLIVTDAGNISPSILAQPTVPDNNTADSDTLTITDGISNGVSAVIVWVTCIS